MQLTSVLSWCSNSLMYTCFS